MKRAHALTLTIVAALVVLVGCLYLNAHSDRELPTPSVTATPTVPAPTASPSPTPSSTSNAHETGEVIGEHLRDGWEVTKDFGQGVWSTLTEDRD